MKKRKVIYVTGCHECPYEYELKFEYYCHQAEIGYFDVTYNHEKKTVRDNCRLKDAE